MVHGCLGEALRDLCNVVRDDAYKETVCYGNSGLGAGDYVLTGPSCR
jgi:hypothetical protein